MRLCINEALRSRIIPAISSHQSICDNVRLLPGANDALQMAITPNLSRLFPTLHTAVCAIITCVIIGLVWDVWVPGLVWIKEMKNTFQGCCLPSRHTHGILQHAHAFKPALVAISVERAPVYGGLVVCLP